MHIRGNATPRCAGRAILNMQARTQWRLARPRAPSGRPACRACGGAGMRERRWRCAWVTLVPRPPHETGQTQVPVHIDIEVSRFIRASIYSLCVTCMCKRTFSNSMISLARSNIATCRATYKRGHRGVCMCHMCDGARCTCVLRTHMLFFSNLSVLRITTECLHYAVCSLTEYITLGDMY